MGIIYKICFNFINDDNKSITNWTLIISRRIENYILCVNYAVLNSKYIYTTLQS